MVDFGIQKKGRDSVRLAPGPVPALPHENSLKEMAQRGQSKQGAVRV